MTTLLNKIQANLSEQAIAGAPMFDYYLNDPSTPNLTVKMGLWALPPVHPDFRILNWNGVVGPLGSYEAQCCQIHNTIAITLEYIDKSYVTPISRWAATQQLVVYPRAGQDFNAYYDRQSLRFFFNVDPETQKTVFTCESSDIVAHELGHAILDSVRPDLWSAASLEVFAFHESFGDVIALLKALQHEELLQYLIDQTGGNLEIPNVVSGLAEELGSAIKPGIANDPLRNALNHFIYFPPEQLPDTRDDKQLGREPHNFSRVFTGACYEILVEIYKKELTHSPAIVALRTARDVLTRLLLNALPISPISPRFFASVAQGMVSVDRMRHNGVYSALIAGVFANRNIYRAPIMMASEPVMKLNAFVSTVEKSDVVQDEVLGDIVLHLARPFIPTLKSILSNAMLQDDTTASAIVALNFLKDNGRIGDDGMFSVQNGELVRNKACFCKNRRR